MLEKGYEQLNLPAIAERRERVAIGVECWHERMVGDLLNPQRENELVLEQLRRDLGSAVFAAQYQQDPVAPEGNLLRWEWFGTYDELPERHEFLKVVQSWDTAMSAAPTSDFSVCTTWGFHREDYKWYLIDVYRQRLDFPDLKRAVIRLRRQWTADIIEDAGSGKSLWQELQASGPFRPVMISAVGCKEERFAGSLAEVEAGNLLLPVDALWLADFRSELKAFPNGRYDDQADSFSQFVGYQLRNWVWILTEYAEDGRPIAQVRDEKRPW